MRRNHAGEVQLGAARAARYWFGFACNAAATFDVFYWLQVTANFDDAPLLQSSPNGVNYNDIARFRLHGDFSLATDTILANVFELYHSLE